MSFDIAGETRFVYLKGSYELIAGVCGSGTVILPQKRYWPASSPRWKSPTMRSR